VRKELKSTIADVQIAIERHMEQIDRLVTLDHPVPAHGSVKWHTGEIVALNQLIDTVGIATMRYHVAAAAQEEARSTVSASSVDHR
jgi:hypothetical protein